MILLTPGVLDQLIQERQRELRTSAVRAPRSAGAAVRVRLGRGLIAAGRALGGDAVEAQPRTPAPHTA